MLLIFLLLLTLHLHHVITAANMDGITVILNSLSPPKQNFNDDGNTTDQELLDDKKTIIDIIRKFLKKKESSKLAIHLINIEKGNTVMAAICNALASGRATMVGSLPPKVTNIFSSLSHAFYFPYITWDAGPTTIIGRETFIQKSIPRTTRQSVNNCFLFSVQPDLGQPLLDFLIAWKWKEFAYLYGSDSAFIRFLFVLRSISTEPYFIRKTTRKFFSSNHHTNSGKQPGAGRGGIVSAYIDVDSFDSIYKSLKYIDHHLETRAERNVVVDIGSVPLGAAKNGRERLEIVFLWLRRMGMLRAEYNYLLVDFNIFELNLEPFGLSGVNITGFHLLDYQDSSTELLAEEWKDVNMPLHDIAFIIDALQLAFRSKTQAQKIFDSLPQNESTERPKCYTSRGTLVKTDLVTKWKAGNAVSNWLLEQELTGQSGIIKFDSDTCTRTRYGLILSKAFGKPNERTIAKWSLHSGWVLPTDNSKQNLFERGNVHNLRERNRDILSYNNILEIYRAKNRTLRVVSVLSKPFMMHASKVPHSVTSGKDNFVGYCKDLANHIFDHLNLNYELHLVKDGMFGALDPVTNVWNGMVGEVLRDEADLIIAPLTMITIRAKYIDFSEPFMNFGLSLMLKKPGKTKPGMFSFLSPLTNQVWLFTAAATVFTAFALRLIAAISPKERTRPDANLGFSIGNSLWFSFASFVHQGIDIFPLSPGARIFASIWRYFCLVIMAYYTANLAAALSVERLISPINSIKDFAERKDLTIKVGTLDSGSTKDFFSTSNDPIYKAIYKNMLKDPSVFVPTMQTGFDRVRNSPYAFVVESKMNEFINHRRPCDTMMVGSTFGSKAYAVGFPSNKAEMRIFKDHVTQAILRLRENQVLAKFYKEWWIEKGECIEGKGESTSEPLALVNLSGVFYILIAGLILAVAIGVLIFLVQIKKAEIHRQSTMKNSACSSYDTSF